MCFILLYNLNVLELGINLRGHNTIENSPYSVRAVLNDFLLVY